MEKQTRGGKRDGAGRKTKKDSEKIKRNSPFQISLTKEELALTKDKFSKIKLKIENRENRKIFNYEALEIILNYFEKNY